MAKKTSRVSQEQSAAAIRAEDEARLGRIYGALLPDVLWLRSRGFTIVKERGRLLIGGRETTSEDLIAKAARERRLAGVSQPNAARSVTKTAAGLKVGAVVPIGPKTVKASPLLSSAKQKLSGAAKAAQEKAAQHSTDLGTRPRVVWLDLGLLKIDTSYQRPIGGAGSAHIGRILKAFNWNCYQPIVVSEAADGSFVVIDGQHRLEAARRHPLITELPCYIIDAPDVAAQASVFVAVNSRRLSLTSLQQFHAALASGEDKAREAASVAKHAGVTILRAPPSTDIPARSIVAPFTLLKMLRQLGRPPVAQALKLLADTHPATKNAFRSPTMVALARLAADRAVDFARLKAVLQGLNLDRFYEEARNDRVTSGGTLESAATRVLRLHVGQRPRVAA